MKDVLAMSAAKTYEIVMNNGIHAYPNLSPYPNVEADFFIPVAYNGIMENIFYIEYRAICNPDNIESLKEELDSVDPYFYSRLMDYHKERESFCGYRENCEFVFLFLFPICAIRQPFKHHIRNAKYYSTEEIPCIGQKTVLEPVRADHAWIFSYDADKFSIHAAMRFLPSIDWDVSNNITRGKVKKNDIVYLYGASPEQKIYYRCRVIKDGKNALL